MKMFLFVCFYISICGIIKLKITFFFQIIINQEQTQKDSLKGLVAVTQSSSYSQSTVATERIILRVFQWYLEARICKIIQQKVIRKFGSDHVYL